MRRTSGVGEPSLPSQISMSNGQGKRRPANHHSTENNGTQSLQWQQLTAMSNLLIAEVVVDFRLWPTIHGSRLSFQLSTNDSTSFSLANGWDFFHCDGQAVILILDQGRSTVKISKCHEGVPNMHAWILQGFSRAQEMRGRSTVLVASPFSCMMCSLIVPACMNRNDPLLCRFSVPMTYSSILVRLSRRPRSAFSG